MNTKRIFALLAAGLLTTSLLSANQYDCCDPCEAKNDFFDRITVGADVLFWSAYTPSLEYARFATVSTIPAQLGHQRWEGLYLEHYFDPGFRLYGEIEDLWCGWDLYASYTWYRSTDKQTFTRGTNQLLTPVHQIPALYNVSPGSVSQIIGKSEIEYQAVDVLVGYDFDCFGPCRTIGVFFGFEGMKLDQRKQTFVRVPIETQDAFVIDWKSEFRGAGAKIGTEYGWLCCSCLKWFANGSFSLLVGDQDDKNQQHRGLGGTIDSTIKEGATLCVPGFHLAAGLDYNTCYCGWDFGVRAGYEFINWWNIPRQRTYQSQTQLQYTTLAAGGHLVLHGFFAGAYVSF